MVNQFDKDAGLIKVLVERHDKQRLPRALSLKEKVERGESLTRFDINFIKDVSNGVNEAKSLLTGRPECQKMAAEMVDLCNEIVEKALLNEKEQ